MKKMKLFNQICVIFFIIFLTSLIIYDGYMDAKEDKKADQAKQQQIEVKK